MTKIIGKDQVKKDLRDLLQFLRIYILDPIQYIKHLPNIHWQSGVVFVFFVNIVFGLIRAIFSQSIINAILGFLITPVMAVILIQLATLFLSYFFQLTLEKNIPYQKLFNILLFAYIPGSLFFLGSHFYAPLFVLGVIVTAALIVIGMVENLEIPKKMILRIVVISGATVLLFWMLQQVYSHRKANEVKSLDQMEKEIEFIGK